VYEDRNSRYEISTGKYVLSYKQCQLCGRALFTAINAELPSIRAQYPLRNARETDAASGNLVAQELIRKKKAWQNERRYASKPANGDTEAAQAWNSYKAAIAAIAAAAAEAADTQSSTTKPRSKKVQLQYERRQVQKTKVLEGDVSALTARDKHNADCRRRQTRHRESKKSNQNPKIKSPLIGATNSRIRREEARGRLENPQLMEKVQGWWENGELRQLNKDELIFVLREKGFVTGNPAKARLIEWLGAVLEGKDDESLKVLGLRRRPTEEIRDGVEVMVWADPMVARRCDKHKRQSLKCTQDASCGD
jgi:hypothetical protein